MHHENKNKVLKGDNVELRALEPSDVDLLYEWENNTDTWQVSNTLVPFSRHSLEQFVLMGHDLITHGQARFIIIANSNPIGAVDLFDFDPMNQRAGVAILIAEKSDRGRGYASEALQLLNKYCFTHLNLHQLYCNIGANNLASIKLFEGQGYQLIGTKKDWQAMTEGFEDELMYQLIK